MFTHHRPISSFFSHFVVHHCSSSLLFDTASFAALVIGSTPNVAYSSRVANNQDGQNQGTGVDAWMALFLTFFLFFCFYSNLIGFVFDLFLFFICFYSNH